MEFSAEKITHAGASATDQKYMNATQTPTGDTMSILKTYEQHWTERMDEIKAKTAARETFGDNSKIESDIDDELEFIRRQIKLGRGQLRTAKSQAERFAQYDDDGYWARNFTRQQATLDFECAIRDELVAGLREMKQQERDYSRTLTRFIAEWEADKAERAARDAS